MLAVFLAATSLQACLSLPSDVTLEGRLHAQTFPGPPNYEDVRAGDRPDRVFVLTLARPICVDDGGEFADPRDRFTQVHLYTTEVGVRRQLRARVGRRIRISGRGFASDNARHRAPLVVEVVAVRLPGR